MPQLLDDPREGRGEVVAGLQLEVPAAGLVGQLPHADVEARAFDPDAGTT